MPKRKLYLPGFFDEVKREKLTKRKLDQPWDSADFARDRLRGLNFLKVAAYVIAFVFLLRLFFLQVIEADKNKNLSEGNRIQLVPVEAVRGRVLDRFGKVLAQSQREYYLEKNGTEVKISDSQVKELERQGLASENFEGELGKIIPRVSRHYTMDSKIAHALGYVSAVTAEDLKAQTSLSGIDSVGRLGVEATYDDFLRGKNGKKLIEVDARGHKVSVLGAEEAKDGGDVSLTIDSTLQEITYNALKKQTDKIGTHRGAVIVQNPSTGEILALVSLPAFDPGNIGASVADRDKPYLDRATQGVYPPGSIFKIATALAGLESGKINKDTEVEDVGEFSLGDVKFSNWFYTQYGQKDGVLKLERAIARSNDIFFYRAAELTGLENIRKMAIKLGFGQKTGVDLLGEELGLVPDEVWKKAQFNLVWFPGDTMHLGIGQGFMLVTPMQIEQMAGFTATGKLMKPYLVSAVNSNLGQVKIGSKVVAENLVSKENFDLVRSGMKMACQKGGTGWPFFDAPYVVGCKTGTAEQAEGNPNAWFTAFAPFDSPKVAITVVVDDGGEGSTVAGPVAREILDWYFKNR